MTSASVFYQGCPVCGRSIRMPVQYFGRQITCVHCGGEFRADVQSDEPSRIDDAALSGALSLAGLMPKGVIPLDSLPAADVR